MSTHATVTPRFRAVDRAPVQVADWASPVAKLKATASAAAMARNLLARMEDKGPKTIDEFEVWHHDVDVRRPEAVALMLAFDRRR
jgi:hypothetical protein